MKIEIEYHEDYKIIKTYTMEEREKLENELRKNKVKFITNCEIDYDFEIYYETIIYYIWNLKK